MTHFTGRDFLRTPSAGAVGLSITYPAFGQGAPTITWREDQKL